MSDKLEKENSVISKIKSFFQGDKLNKSTKIKNIVLIFLVVIILIIFISSFNTKDEKSKKNINLKTNSSALEYSVTLENRLTNVLEKIKGVKNVEVFIMVDSSPTIKYLEETKDETTKKNEVETNLKETQIVLAKNGTITTPIVVVEIMPKITGVLVVANGVNNIKTKVTLINAISAILDVDTSRVEVMEGK